MTERTVFKSEEKLSRDNASAKIAKISEKLLLGKLELSNGGDSVSLDIPENVELEIKVEEEGDETSLELEVEWSDSEEGEVEIG